MGPDHDEVTRLFLEACRLHPEQRSRWLDRECDGDVELRREVESLLAQDELAGSRAATDALAAEVRAATRETAEEAERDRPPARVGPYRALRLLGRGGMGEVWLAEQSEPVSRLVAVKVIQRGMDSSQVVARFESERQTLAQLDHPNIARVLDAGADEAGRPWFAMELVRGAPVTEYCRSARLDVEQRIRLFLEVCRAVRHAHRRGVIHRDLKPSNILVSEVQGRPVAKVIDFSIAKVLDVPVLGTEHRTRTGQLVGTLEYMSPEQARGAVGQIDTRSDVYALGVVLYELLAERLPLELGDLPLHEAVRRIQQDPPDPIRKGSPGASTVSGQVDADVATIVGKCLEKQPDRRYGSAAELAADIERFLASRPILARPPSAGYQLRKLVSRHRVATGVGVLILGFLVVFSITVSVQLGIQRRERARAESEAHKATQVTAFLTEMLAAARPEELGRDVTVREVLDLASATMDQTVVDEPEVRAAVLHAMGTTYRSLGLYDEAEPLLAEALKLREAALGEMHADTIGSLNELGWLYYQQDRFDEAAPILERSVRLAREYWGAEHKGSLNAVNNLAVLAWKQGRYETAERLYSQSLEIARRVMEKDDVITLKTLNNLAILFATTGRLSEAEPLFEETLERRRRVLGEDHPLTLRALSNVARAYLGLHRRDELLPLVTELVEARRRVLGEEHPETLMARELLAAAHGELGEVDEAERIYRRVIEAQERVQGPDHSETIATRSDLALTLAGADRFEDAYAVFDEVLAALAKRHGKDHPDYLATLVQYGKALLAGGRHARARDALVAAHAGRRRVLGEDSPATTIALLELGRACRATGDLGRAGECFREVANRREGTLGPDHPDTLDAWYRLARVACRQGNHQAAIELLTRIIDRGWAEERLLADGDWEALRGQPAFEIQKTRVEAALAGL